MHNLHPRKRLHPLHILAHAKKHLPRPIHIRDQHDSSQDGGPQDRGEEVVEDEVEGLPFRGDLFRWRGLLLGGGLGHSVGGFIGEEWFRRGGCVLVGAWRVRVWWKRGGWRFRWSIWKLGATLVGLAATDPADRSHHRDVPADCGHIVLRKAPGCWRRKSTIISHPRTVLALHPSDCKRFMTHTHTHVHPIPMQSMPTRARTIPSQVKHQPLHSYTTHHDRKTSCTSGTQPTANSQNTPSPYSCRPCSSHTPQQRSA